MKSDHELASVREALEQYSYVCTERKGKDFWYVRHITESDELLHHVFLEYQPKNQAYAVRAGIACRPAMLLMLKAKSIWLEFLPPGLRSGKLAIVDEPCWTLFSAAWVLGSDFLSVPNPLKRNEWKEQVSRLTEEFFSRYLWPINNTRLLCDFLAEDAKPFGWWNGISVLRAVDFVGVSKLLGHSGAEIQMKLERVKNKINRDLAPGKKFEDFSAALGEV